MALVDSCPSLLPLLVLVCVALDPRQQGQDSAGRGSSSGGPSLRAGWTLDWSLAA